MDLQSINTFLTWQLQFVLYQDFFFFFACLSEFMWEAQLRTLPHSLKTATTGMQICTDKVTAIEAETTLFTLDY